MNIEFTTKEVESKVCVITVSEDLGSVDIRLDGEIVAFFHTSSKGKVCIPSLE